MKFFRTCSKIMAIGAAMAFLISAPIALLLFNLQNYILNPHSIMTILDEQNIYDQLPSILAQQIPYIMTYNPCLEHPEQCEGENPEEAGDNNGIPDYMEHLSVSNWELILSHLLTPEWIKSQTESVLNQLYDFLNSDEEKLNITVSLVGLRENLRGQRGMELMRILLDAQPPCTETQLALLLDAYEDDLSPDQLLTCRPPEKFMDRLGPPMEAALERAIQDIPDQIILGNKIFNEVENRSAPTNNESPSINLRSLRSLMQLIPLLPLIFLIFLTIFGVRSWKDFFFGWGIPFILVGMFVLVLGLIGVPMLDWGLKTFVVDRIPGFIHPSLQDLSIDLLKLFVQSFMRVIAVQAVWITFLGIILSGAGLLITYRSRKKA